jgi:DNA (cytosine-5)-methyltransferase 1
VDDKNHDRLIKRSTLHSAPPWWPRERTERLRRQIAPQHVAWIDEHLHSNSHKYATAFRRMRLREDAVRSTAELRTDGIAGCLRTPKGGSARQILVRVGRGAFNARHLTPRECARLMGADDFTINTTDTKALFGFGDAVCVPAITWIAEHRLNPAIHAARSVATPIGAR